MLDLETYGIIGYFAFVLFIILIRIIAVAVVAGVISSYVGLTGLLWWCATIVIFLVINAIISGLRG